MYFMPQSGAGISRSGAMCASAARMRSATSCGCSTRLVAWLTTPGISILPGGPRPRVRASACPTSRADRSSICKRKPAATQRVGQGEQEFLLGLVVFVEDKVVEPAGRQDRDERLLDRRTRVLDRRLEGVELAVDGLGPLRFERTAGDDPHRDRRHRRRDATASAAILEALM